ncbi:MAG: response regulator transcription factor [Pedobacter sp.]|nr:MAG: response regulator transcription factor [Pedobacter sp.]
MHNHILLVEDDLDLGLVLKQYLEFSGFAITWFSNPVEALKNLATLGNIELAIIDVMMPGLNGLQVCKLLREQQIKTPILLLTALGTVDDKVTGLESGADDYLVKPFHLRELLARIAALLRRTSEVENNLLCFDDLCLDTASKEVTRAGKSIELSAKEFILLELFLRNPNRLLSRQFIAERAWDINFETGTNVIDVYINFLRKKIEKGFDRKLIHTKINMGYILK